jgi:hypothetical protein
MKTMLMSLLLGACVGAEPAPQLTFALVPLSNDSCDELPPGARGEGWQAAGIYEVGIDEHPDVVIYVDAGVSNLFERVGSYGMADRGRRIIYLDHRLSVGFQLDVAAAHEIGHVVLDTDAHTGCGIMAGADTSPCDEDLELACSAAGLGCE